MFVSFNVIYQGLKHLGNMQEGCAQDGAQDQGESRWSSSNSSYATPGELSSEGDYVSASSGLDSDTKIIADMRKVVDFIEELNRREPGLPNADRLDPAK